MSVQGDPLQLRGTTKILVSLRGVMFHTSAVVVDFLTTDVIVGRDFLQSEQCTIEMGAGSSILHFHGRGVSISLGNDQSDPVLEQVSAGVACVGIKYERPLKIWKGKYRS